MSQPTLSGQSRDEEFEALKSQVKVLVAEKADLVRMVQGRDKQLERARQAILDLEAKLDAASASKLPDLGDAAFELADSVTIASAAGVRIDARKGEVVTIEDPQAVLELIGSKAKVHQVKPDTIDELKTLGLLRTR
jgi:uncharacterized protein YlxW (UPF0749 family)